MTILKLCKNTENTERNPNRIHRKFKNVTKMEIYLKKPENMGKKFNI